MTIHSSIIRIIIRVIGYFRLLASTRTYVLRYVVRDDSRNFVPSTRQRSTSIAKIPSLPFLPLKFSRIERHESLSNSSMEKEIRSSLFASIPLHASPPPPLARSNAKKWNEINADNCRQQLAAVPACRPTSLTGLRVARSCFAADRFHRHSLCSQLQSGKLSSRSAEQRNKPSHAFPE